MRGDRDAWKAEAEEALRLLTDANTRRDQDIAMIERLEADLAQAKHNESSLVREIARQREAHAEQVKRMQEQIDAAKYYAAETVPEKSCENCANGPFKSKNCAWLSCRGFTEQLFKWEPRR